MSRGCRMAFDLRGLHSTFYFSFLDIYILLAQKTEQQDAHSDLHKGGSDPSPGRAPVPHFFFNPKSGENLLQQ